jgi:hypothetical protein
LPPAIVAITEKPTILNLSKSITMKKVFNYRNTAIALFTALTLTISASANATDDKNPATAVELKYIGNFNNKPVFELKINKAVEGGQYLVNIRDEDGNSLYRETLTASKKFMLNTDEIGNDVLRFEITGKADNSKLVYTVNQNSRFIDEVSVTKLD